MRHKVLLVDDAQSMHALVKARLEDDSIAVYSAYTGQAGLELARALQPDLILLDVSLPAPDGFEVCRRLKGHPATELIPVIFFTASGATQDQFNGLEMGAWDYITKPFEPQLLRARVHTGLRTKRMLDLLEQRTLVDGLTGLWNRTAFDRRLVSELAQAHRNRWPLSCVMADLDGLGPVNENNGHLAGDEVIRAAGKLLVEQGRVQDLACRYGGDEFTILMPNTGPARAAAVAEQLRAAVAAAAFGRGADTVRLTCSFGVSGFDAGGDEAAGSLVDLADRALRRAKRAGGNRVEIDGPDASKADAA